MRHSVQYEQVGFYYMYMSIASYRSASTTKNREKKVAISSAIYVLLYIPTMNPRLEPEKSAATSWNTGRYPI